MQVIISNVFKNKIIKIHSRGDFADISKTICGTADRRMEVKRAFDNGYGDETVVKPMLKYYRAKIALSKKVNSSPRAKNSTPKQTRPTNKTIGKSPAPKMGKAGSTKRINPIKKAV